MDSLDDLGKISELDKGNILGSIEALSSQIKQVWVEIFNSDPPKECFLAKNVVISGMGGSALGGRIIDSLVYERVRVPIEVLTEYKLPNYVSKETLVILCSYSGNTAETVSAAHEALKKDANIFGITTGGKLGELFNKENLPSYIFEPRANPSNQPRMGVGYSITAILAILAKCGFLVISNEEITKVFTSLESQKDFYGPRIPHQENIAKRTALKLKHKIPILIASEHLVGAAHAFKNMFNENSKCFSVLFDLPELNHHLMEGLKFPAEAKKFFYFLFFKSDLYSSEIQKRYPITQDVVAKNEVESEIYTFKTKTKLEQIFELISLGSYVSFYLAMLYGIDPSPIPWVDYFKNELAKK